MYFDYRRCDLLQKHFVYTYVHLISKISLVNKLHGYDNRRRHLKKFKLKRQVYDGNYLVFKTSNTKITVSSWIEILVYLLSDFFRKSNTSPSHPLVPSNLLHKSLTGEQATGQCRIIRSVLTMQKRFASSSRPLSKDTICYSRESTGNPRGNLVLPWPGLGSRGDRCAFSPDETPPNERTDGRTPGRSSSGERTKKKTRKSHCIRVSPMAARYESRRERDGKGKTRRALQRTEPYARRTNKTDGRSSAANARVPTVRRAGSAADWEDAVRSPDLWWPLVALSASPTAAPPLGERDKAAARAASHFLTLRRGPVLPAAADPPLLTSLKFDSPREGMYIYRLRRWKRIYVYVCMSVHNVTGECVCERERAESLPAIKSPLRWTGEGIVVSTVYTPR